ncbi:hypothetical protein DOTSEDRAFT_47469 [Dothistroma septosporum NZE10]|uniref:PEBP-like protein n=1 Tax=Dothistroma septosporum (strain NZE10 / CBS 128990) TaxID=675120 RepID=N1PCI1_DOTSN|nr:hypothetical protein DOTSEDRAFT_47469 [Dothistroma septosporum NZE10]
MFLTILTSLALAIAPAVAIPPPSFGFPEAPNDTALTVRFQDGAQTTLVQEAALYGINVTANEPSLSLNTGEYRSLADYNGSYTIIMVDPDASYPENPTSRFILHWLQPNTSRANASSSMGETTSTTSVSLTNVTAPRVPFRRPSPPTNSSAHRYIIYAFQQPMNFTIPSQWSGLSDGNRTRFNLTNFIRDTNLGTPAAANYFYVSNQTNVPANFTASPGGQYPGGDGSAVTSGDPYKPTGSAAGGSGGSSSSSARAAMVTGVGSLVGAGLLGLAALL